MIWWVEVVKLALLGTLVVKTVPALMAICEEKANRQSPSADDESTQRGREKMSNEIKMSETEVKTSEKLIQCARDALSSISLEEIVVMLHQRFPHQWQWEAFKEHLLASAKDLISTKDQP